MPDLHILSGAYALDALDEIERRGYERHLRDCDTCTLEVREFAEAAASLAERVAAPAPRQLHDRVMAEVSRTRQLPSRQRREVRGPSARRVLLSAAAAVLIAAGAALSGIAWQSHNAAEDARNEAAHVARVLTSPDRIDVVNKLTGGGTATAAVADGQAVLSTNGVPAAPTGKEYQMWVIRSASDIRSAGELQLQSGSGSALVTDVPDGAVLAITIEPDGGSKQPTSDPIVQLRAG